MSRNRQASPSFMDSIEAMIRIRNRRESDSDPWTSDHDKAKCASPVPLEHGASVGPARTLEFSSLFSLLNFVYLRTPASH